MFLFDWLLGLFAVLLLIFVAVLLLQVLVAYLPAKGQSVLEDFRPRIAVLVPAHNESAVIVSTLASLRSQLHEADRLLVVADNCSDDTASLARSAGAEVLERVDLERRGKGFALDFGLHYLQAVPPEVLVIVDADCQVAPEALHRLAARALQKCCPVQGLYLMFSPP